MANTNTDPYAGLNMANGQDGYCMPAEDGPLPYDENLLHKVRLCMHSIDWDSIFNLYQWDRI